MVKQLIFNTFIPPHGKIVMVKLLHFIKSQFKNFGKTNYIFKNIAFPLKIKEQSGQGIVELILLLVVIVSLAYSLARHMYAPLQRYGSSLFTNTIACSLEYGQLPAEISSEDGCSTNLQTTAMSADRFSSRNTSRENNNDNNSNSTQNEIEKKPSESSGRSEVAAQGGRSGAGSSSSSNSFKLSPPTGTEAKGSNNKEIVSDISGSRNDSSSDYSASIGRRAKRLTKEIKDENMIELINKKIKPKEVRRIIAEVNSGAGGKSKRFIVNNKKDEKELKTTDESWDVSKILRIVLIFLMFLAIIVFVLFQVAQIRRGAES